MLDDQEGKSRGQRSAQTGDQILVSRSSANCHCYELYNTYIRDNTNQVFAQQSILRLRESSIANDQLRQIQG